jgi:hypothetical protein
VNQILLCHCSPFKNRDSILAQGILPHKPTEDGNYVAMDDFLCDQPRGIYVTPVESSIWKGGNGQDQWTLPYCGPISPDPEFPGYSLYFGGPAKYHRSGRPPEDDESYYPDLICMVIPDAVPPEALTLKVAE